MVRRNAVLGDGARRLNSAARNSAVAASPRIESLESRLHFDVVPSIVGALPTETIVATTKTKDTITVALTNTGAAASPKGAATLALFASADQTLGGDTQIAQVNLNLPALKPGASKLEKIKLGALPTMATGSYFILAQLSGAAAGAGDNLAVSTGTVSIAAPFIDLSDATTTTGGAIKVGKTADAMVEVFNYGNVIAGGPLEIVLQASTNADGSNPDPSPILTVTEKLKLKPGGHAFYKLTKKVGAGTTAGTYYLIATIDPSNTFNEVNTANNVSVGAAGVTITVTSSFPNAVGAYTGTATIISGQDAGQSQTPSLSITTEGADGSLSGMLTGENNPHPFSGTISAGGVITGQVTNGDGSLSTIHGTLVGNVISGTYHDGGSSNDVGNFSLTRH